MQSMAQQMSTQQQQWQGFLSAAQAPGAFRPPTLGAAAPVPAAATAAGAGTDAAGAVRSKLEFLQREVESVIASAVAMQQQQGLGVAAAAGASQRSVAGFTAGLSPQRL